MSAAERHLTEEELLEWLDGSGRRDWRRHLGGCGTCRAREAALRDLLDGLRDAAVPEPPQLYWTQLSGRIRAALDELPRSPAWWQIWLTPRFGLVAVSATIVVCLLTGLAWLNRPPVQGGQGGVVWAGNEPGADSEWSADWDLVVSLATGFDWDDAEAIGLSVSPGAADRAVLQLTPGERQQLATMLEEAIRSPKS